MVSCNEMFLNVRPCQAAGSRCSEASVRAVHVIRWPPMWDSHLLHSLTVDPSRLDCSIHQGIMTRTARPSTAAHGGIQDVTTETDDGGEKANSTLTLGNLGSGMTKDEHLHKVCDVCKHNDDERNVWEPVAGEIMTVQKIVCIIRESFTQKWHHTIIGSSGHRGFIKNMITMRPRSMLHCSWILLTATSHRRHSFAGHCRCGNEILPSQFAVDDDEERYEYLRGEHRSLRAAPSFTGAIFAPCLRVLRFRKHREVWCYF